MHSRMICTLIVLLCAEALLSAALPLAGGPGDLKRESLTAADAQVAEERDERKVGALHTTAGPFEYVRELQNELAYPDGKPRNPEQDPTNIWYILDKDVMDDNYRERPQNAQKCSSVYRFVFAWETLVESCEEKMLPVRSAKLRTYLQVIPRLLRTEAVEVDISTAIQPLKCNGTATNERIAAGHERILVTRDSNQWLELNITEGIKTLWPPTKDQPHVEVFVTMTVNCQGQSKVPASLVDPASISLNQPKRRERHKNLQPILLVFVDDEDVRLRVKEDSAEMEPEMDVLNTENQTLSSNRVERRSSSGACDIEDFWISFTTISLPHFRIPSRYNARKCAGSCHHTTLKRDPGLGNNHAKLMASAHVASQLSGHTLYEEIPSLPCCVPIRYSPVTIIMQTREGWKSQLFASMTVEECGCR